MMLSLQDETNGGIIVAPKMMPKLIILGHYDQTLPKSIERTLISEMKITKLTFERGIHQGDPA